MYDMEMQYGDDGEEQQAADPTFIDAFTGVATTGLWLSDLDTYFDLTGANVNKWKDAKGDTDADISFVSGTKCILDATHPVNTTVKTVRNAGATSLNACGANGKSSKFWPGGVGSSFWAVKLIDAISDGGMGALTGVNRHGDSGSWGGLLRIAKRGAGSDFRIAHTVYDGSTKTAEDNPVGAILAGWHRIHVRNTGTNLFLQVDDRAEVNAGGAGAMAYLDGLYRILSPYNTDENVAIAIHGHSGDYSSAYRDAVGAILQGLIADLP